MTRPRILIGLAVVLLLFAVSAAAADQPIILVFYEEGCPSCEEMEEFLAGMTTGLPDSAVARYEINEPDALRLLASLEEAYGLEAQTVPVVFVGDVATVGSGRDQEFKLRDAISRCEIYGCSSPLDRVLTPESIRADLLRVAFFGALFLLLLLWQTS
jgi:hypothetical protein